MSVLNIREAKREGARLVTALAGISGSGKTKTALLLAYGMANGDGKKVGFLDTENRRGSLYADKGLLELVQSQLGLSALPEMFLIGDLDAPFSPKRYTEALQEFQAAGVDVVVVDSVSHEWEGIGGCEEIAERGAIRGMKDWSTAKAEHKKFVNALLASNMHVIVCVRAREKVKIGKDASGKTVVESLGIQPICEKNFMFEMTASMTVYDGGKARDVAKSSGVEDIFGHVGFAEGYLTCEHGQRLRAWVDGAKQLDPQVEAARNTLRTITEQGVEAYKAAWPKLPGKIKRALTDDGSHDRLKRAAEDYDRMRKESQPGGAAMADLNREVLGDGGNENSSE